MAARPAARASGPPSCARRSAACDTAPSHSVRRPQLCKRTRAKPASRRTATQPPPAPPHAPYWAFHSSDAPRPPTLAPRLRTAPPLLFPAAAPRPPASAPAPACSCCAAPCTPPPGEARRGRTPTCQEGPTRPSLVYPSGFVRAAPALSPPPPSGSLSMGAANPTPPPSHRSAKAATSLARPAAAPHSAMKAGVASRRRVGAPGRAPARPRSSVSAPRHSACGRVARGHVRCACVAVGAGLLHWRCESHDRRRKARVGLQ
jgi:hypothetical protein